MNEDFWAGFACAIMLVITLNAIAWGAFTAWLSSTGKPDDSKSQPAQGAKEADRERA